MEVNTLAVETRTVIKKGATKSARKDRNIPAVVYGRNTPKHILVSEKEFEKKFYKVSENTIIALLEKDSKLADVLIKDYQEDLRTQRIMHIDFFEVDTNKKLKTNVPVVLTGTSVGVKAGGILEHLLHVIEVECFPKDIPEKITVDIGNLNIGDSIYLKDLKKMDNVKFYGQEDTLVAHVIHLKAATEEPAAAATGVETSEPAKASAGDKKAE